MEKTPYDYLPSYYIDRPELFAFLENSLRTDYIITIHINDEEINELLQWDWHNDSWIWENDWWEGEKNVTWSGIIAIGDVETRTPDPRQTYYNAL